jgi:hypothetical protein
MTLFAPVRFHISSSLNPQSRAHLAALLVANKARPVPLPDATHVVSDTTDFDGRDDLQDGAHVVIVRHTFFSAYFAQTRLNDPQESWVHRSLVLGMMMPCALLFSYGKWGLQDQRG